ncbi:thioesterase family protein [Bacillus sp. CGMCC 1.16607]|uniref:thioesterase family protein n=1 Tax=Bacillus sp. CGMCC 1.16607 TaxID=3351842 RepID=UPI0036332B28
MKPGLEVGQTETIYTKVTPNMFAQFEGNVVHPAYSTVSMIYHMEWASRKIILPYLEDHEEGMGGAVSAKHIAASPEGSQLTIKAELIEYNRNIVVTKVSVFRESELVGIGEVKQVIVPKQKIMEMLTKHSSPS